MEKIINHLAITKNRPEYMGYIPNNRPEYMGYITNTNIYNNYVYTGDVNNTYRHTINYDTSTGSKSNNNIEVRSIHS